MLLARLRDARGYQECELIGRAGYALDVEAVVHLRTTFFAHVSCPSARRHARGPIAKVSHGHVLDQLGPTSDELQRGVQYQHVKCQRVSRQ